jgi:hypothetical protein
MATGPDRVVPEIILCLAAAAITLAAIRAVVRRAQTANNVELVTADDALRAHSLHVVAGTGLAVVAVCSAGSLFQLGLDSAARPLRWTCPWLGLAELVLAGTAWFGLRTAPWWVRKPPTS